MSAQVDDTPELVDTLAATFASLRELIGGLTEKQWSSPTGCPGWTVKDHLSHVVGLELDLDGRPDVEVALFDLPHLTDGNRGMENSVQARRETPSTAIVSEFDEVSAARISGLHDLLAAPGFDPMAKARGPFGWQLPLRTLIALRVFDVFSHELDIRRATGAPDGLDHPAFVVSWRRTLSGLAATLPTVLPTVAGRTIMVRVTHLTGPDRLRVLNFTGEKPVVTDPAEGDPPDVSLSIAAPNFMALGCGRTDADPGAAVVTGDTPLGAQVLAHFGVTP